jgi:hypothetical protein
MKWKDTTSYSREAKEKIPTTWEVVIPGARIIVHRWMHDDRTWYGTCRELGEDKRLLSSKFLEEAQLEFLNHLADKAKKLFTELSKAADS